MEKNLTLTKESLSQGNWPASYKLPGFDIEAMTQRTKEAPTWLHIGAGNIFRIFLAGLQQDLLDAGHTNTGIVVYESYDEGIIPASFTPYDNLTLAVSLGEDGSIQKRIIASMADAFHSDLERLSQVIAMPSLQIITFTITEKGYAAQNICKSPSNAATAMEQVTAGLLARYNADAPPLALVAMDNFAENGTKVSAAAIAIAKAWQENNQAPAGFAEYVQAQSYPWTMIDKITPSPSPAVAKILESEGFASTAITQTAKHTTIAPFVNAEGPQYLVIEDAFPNGRPPFEKAIGAGVYLTDRETVRKSDQMKVCACLNPLHTILGVCGTLLGYPTIAACMQDKRLVALINHAAREAMPTVANPGIINPQDFLNEVVTKRFPNPFIPDTPARINMDASQKIPVRFGVTLSARSAAGMDIAGLEAIPRFIALWLRYRMATDDTGAPMALSPDPKLPAAVLPLEGLRLGEDAKTADLQPILSDTDTFGVDLYAAGLAGKITEIFTESASQPGAVSRLLSEWYA
ncbi:MAG: mannitol dehydrogenase family protein [Defluviitaleaceae bacterium]|nr:mannitol dehydrogenase family protein [Defluviitaleaceae bacterium]